MKAAPFIPEHIKDATVFYDRKRGMTMLARYVNGPDWWLFLHDPKYDNWEVVRRATDEDIDTVEAAMKQ